MTALSDYPFTFDQSACEKCRGACCRWGGYVWVTEEDIQAMADLMNVDLEAFAEEYLRAAYGRLSLQERLRDGEYQCALFDPFTGSCLVYQARPEQCRTFPYWEAYRENCQDLLGICPGVAVKEGRGDRQTRK
jgi:Fe-S-cluster containining protein